MIYNQTVDSIRNSCDVLETRWEIFDVFWDNNKENDYEDGDDNGEDGDDYNWQWFVHIVGLAARSS